jgi:hypothetical protein
MILMIPAVKAPQYPNNMVGNGTVNDKTDTFLGVFRIDGVRIGFPSEYLYGLLFCAFDI